MANCKRNDGLDDIRAWAEGFNLKSNILYRTKARMLAQTSLLLPDRRHITYLPDGIGQLSTLETFCIYGSNYLSEPPESIGWLRQLENLTIWENKLTCLPTSIGKLSRLTNLSLPRNQPHELPESIGQLSSLTSLDVTSIN